MIFLKAYWLIIFSWFRLLTALHTVRWSYRQNFTWKRPSGQVQLFYLFKKKYKFFI